MSVPQNVSGVQPCPDSGRRRVAVAHPLVVEREYQPDPERCVRAVIALLTSRPSPTSSAGRSGEIGSCGK